MKEKFLYKIYIVFCVALVLLFAYLMLDFFVIPKASEKKPTRKIDIVTEAPTPFESSTPIGTETEESATPVPTEAPTEVPATPTPVPMPTSALENNEYHDDNIDIVVTKYRMHSTDVYVADVRLKSVFNLKTAFAKDTYGKNIIQTTSTQAKNKGAVLAVNGDFYGKRENGYVVRNAEIFRDSKSKKNERNTDVDLAILQNGSFRCFSEAECSMDVVASWNPWHVLSFGPSLLENGEVTVKKGYDVMQSMSSNPRTAIAEIEPLHYLFAVSDGRTDENAGLSLVELAEILKNLGAKTAYNLDGGGSTAMYFNGRIINKPYNSGRITERYVSDIVYVSP